MRLSDRALLYACDKSWRAYMSASFSVTVQCGRRDVRIPIMRGCGKALLNYTDLRIQGVISDLHRAGRRGRVVDIGANLGMVILNVAALDLDLPYIGFEPDVAAAYYTRELIRLNGFRDHDIIPVALGTGNSNATMHTNGPGYHSNTLGLEQRPAQMYCDTVRVAVSTADDQLGGIEGPIFLVKIDSEGWELNILRGMTKILNEKRPPVYFEVMGYRHFLDGTYPRQYFGGELSKDELERLVAKRRQNMNDLEAFWRQQDYTVSICRPDGARQRVTTLDPGPESQDNCGEMNFLAMHASQ